MNNIRPNTDYKNTAQIMNHINRYRIICSRVKELIEKTHDPLLSSSELDLVNKELDGFAVELEELIIVLEQQGYMNI